MKLQAVLWDVDGTIAETERDGHRIAFNLAFEAHGLPWQWSVERYGELLLVTGGRERLLHDMAIRLAMTGAMRKVFAEMPSEFDPRKAFTEARKAARGIVKARFEAFGCAGQGSKIKPVPLEAMAKRYG